MKYLTGTFIVMLLAGCGGKYYEAPTQSMENTIMMRERFYVSNAHEFKRNDIVAFDIFTDDYGRGPDENGHFNKRWESRVYRLIALS
jgi:signal peptidase I